MGEVFTSARETEESAREWIDSLDPSAYCSDGTWHASDTPGDLLDDGRQLGQLLYDVRIEEGEWRERLTSRASVGGCLGSIDVQDATIVVQFSLRARSTGDLRREDWSRAADAAEHVLRALTSPPFRNRRTSPPERVMAPALGGVGPWIVVTVRVATEIWLHLDPVEAGPTGVAPTNTTIPTIQGTIAADEEIWLYPGTWAGSQPITFDFSLTIDAVEVASGAMTAAGAPFTMPSGYTDETVLLEVTASNGTAPDGVAESQPVGAGGVVDCAVTCAAEIDAATAAGVATGTAAGLVTGNAEGRAARELYWRNPGLFATSPDILDPLSLGTWGTPDGTTGQYTITMISGVAATFLNGTQRIWPLVSATGGAIAVTDLYGAIRVACSGNATSSPLRWWAVVMDSDDPTTARGWGAYGGIEAGSADVLPGILYTPAAGTWAAALASASFNAGNMWVEASRAMAHTAGGRFMAGRRNFVGSVQTGASTHAVETTPATVALPDFAGGAWAMIGMGSQTTGLAAGGYTLRAQFGLIPLDPADANGIGETP